MTKTKNDAFCGCGADFATLKLVLCAFESVKREVQLSKDVLQSDLPKKILKTFEQIECCDTEYMPIWSRVIFIKV